MYKLEPLPYSYEALEPFIDTHTVGVHYHKHHHTYLNNLNKELNRYNYDYRYSKEELVTHIDEFPIIDRGKILFNLGGVLNHNLYWKSMSPNDQIKPKGKLLEQINNKYGSVDSFIEHFKTEIGFLVGSGYTFLVADSKGKLNIINMSNQETPLSYSLIPLFNIDLWEHAYYLNYKNEKSKYVDNFFDIADFGHANEIYNTKFN